MTDDHLKKLVLSTRRKPENHYDLMERIVHYGAFNDGLLFITRILKSTSPITVILRGSVGCGKKTLIKEALALSELSHQPSVVYLNPFHHTEDYMALKYIASKLDLKSRSSTIPDLIDAIEARSKQKNKGKIVIILLEFEEFCRQKQGLLYCLTNLTQHGEKIALIGLTISLDCTKNLEKRVRSRLMTEFYELSPPYRNRNEYLEFSSLLLGGHKIEGRLREQLEFMYNTTNRSIRPLKRFLLTCCSWYNKKLTIDPPAKSGVDPNSDVHLLRGYLSWLTRPQLELLKMAVYTCFQSDQNEFTLQKLKEVAETCKLTRFETSSPLAYKNTALLAKIGLFKQLKPGQMITQHTQFVVGVMPDQFKHVIENNPEFQAIKTDILWKRL